MNKNFNILNPFDGEKPETFKVDDYKAGVRDFCDNSRSEKRVYQIVILAAGQGTRMGIDYPKALYELDYPDGSSTLLSNMLNGIESLKKFIDVSEIYLAVDQKASHHFKAKYSASKINIIELSKPDIRGTAISINAVKRFLNPKHETIVLWGDLALWRVSDLNMVLNVQSLVDSCLAFSTRLMKDPYVAFLRSADGKLSSVVHGNETERYSGTAEQDCLSFVFTSNALAHLDDFISISSSKGEVDFVHFIPYLAAKGLDIIAIPIAEEGTIFGLNTPERANQINQILRKLPLNSYIKLFRNLW
jgi:bifunctional N-acetylglucosamine-1-phosphate-uridyltransferase/glucosamine-1-phosphate-acetyltransferase GlmU-like protein